MQVLIFSWEYPPRKIGQLAEYVEVLSKKLVKNGIKTYVITYHDFLTGLVEDKNGVVIVRVTNPVRNHTSVLTWILTLNQEIERAAANIIHRYKKKISLMNVYDWHFIPAAVTLKNAFRIPFLFSVESLEDQRSKKANNPYNMAIKSIEWLGFYEADKISVKFRGMKNEIIKAYNVPSKKIEVLGSNSLLDIGGIRIIFSTIGRGKRKK
jgi:glycogen(starch) synthase